MTATRAPLVLAIGCLGVALTLGCSASDSAPGGGGQASGTPAWKTPVALGDVNAHGVRSLAVSATHVYVTTSGVGTEQVARVAKDGGAVEVISADQSAYGITVAGEQVCWVNRGVGATGEAWCMPDAGGAPTRLADNLNDPMGIASDGSNLVWTTVGDSSVSKFVLPSGPLQTLAGPLGSPTAVATASGNVFWIDATDGSVWSVGMDGGSAKKLGSPKCNASAVAFGLAARGSVAYCGSWIAGGAGSVMAVSLDGTVTKLGPGQVYGPSGGIAVDDSFAYWPSPMGAKIFSTPLGGGDDTMLVQGETAEAIAVDATGLYWAAYGTTVTIMKMAR